jgi:hypothetical protein
MNAFLEAWKIDEICSGAGETFLSFEGSLVESVE